jgi:hypothetical protein
MSQMLSYALWYAQKGFYVFPLHTPRDGRCSCGMPLGRGEGKCQAKHPRTYSGNKEATLDAEIIRDWWTQWPDANVGISTGRSGFFVVDLDIGDGKNGADSWSRLLDQNGGVEGSPLEIRTGSGGTHLLYKHVEGITTSRGSLPNGIDIRGAGGYIVAPPSLHYSGGRYEWLSQPGELQPPPAWLVAAIRTKTLPDAAPVALEGAHALTREDLQAFLAYKAKFPDAAPVVRVARAVLEGEPWADKGERHQRMVQFLGALRTFVLDKHGAPLDPGPSSELFAATCDAVNAQGVDTLTGPHWVAGLIGSLEGNDPVYRGKLEAARKAAKEKKAETEKLADRLELPSVAAAGREVQLASVRSEHPADVPASVEESIGRAFERTEPGRTTAYRSEEIAAMEPTLKRWVLGTPAGYFLRGPRGYYHGPFTRELVVGKARDLLAPAWTAGVRTHKRDDESGDLKPMSLAELMDVYGVVPSEMSYSYCIERSTLENDCFTQRAAIARTFEPEYSAEIARWLELFAGEHQDALLDWLATLTDLSKPTCAVCIVGTSGAGKDLFIDGLSEIWSKQRTPFERAIGHFNSTLLSSPLVVANESLRAPSHYPGNVVDALKEVISDTRRIVEAKYAQPVPLTGAARVILATNKSGAFKLDRQPTESDLVALDDRILLLHPPAEAKPYLESLGGREFTEAWVAGGAFPRHVAWLQATRKVDAGPRFLVQGRGGMSALLAADGKGSSPVLKALLQALLAPLMADETVCCAKAKGVWASMKNLTAKWPTFGGKDGVPDEIGDVFKTICEVGEGRSVRVGEQVVKMRPLKLSVLRRAADREGLLEELAAKLERSDEAAKE